MRSVVSVDGVITDAERAVVPVLDRGFLYGDSVYEVFWWHRGVLIQAADHFARLRASAQRIYMEVPGPDARYADAIRRAVEASGCPPDGDAYVRLVVTRGITSIGLKLDGARNGAVVVVVQDAHRPTPAEWARGLRVALVNRLRVSADALDPAAKTGNYMNNLLALHEARQRGADDAVLLNDRARVTEASTANVYRVYRGVLETPPLAAGILRGTTRTRILALCARQGQIAHERDLVASDLRDADEVFLSSSVRGVIPVVAVDDAPVGRGVPGPVTTQVRAWFEAEADAEADVARGTRGPAAVAPNAAPDVVPNVVPNAVPNGGRTA